jgi:hypothetical protein
VVEHDRPRRTIRLWTLRAALLGALLAAWLVEAGTRLRLWRPWWLRRRFSDARHRGDRHWSNHSLFVFRAQRAALARLEHFGIG